MKNLIRLAALLGLLVLTGCPKPDPRPTASDKLLHLAFDGSTYDSASHHYTVNSAGTIKYGADRFGKKDGAIVLDGSTKLVLPNAQELEFDSSSSYSVTGWIRTRDTASVCILGKGAASSRVPGYSLQLRNGRPLAQFTGAGQPVELATSVQVSDNIWHLITLSVSPDSIFIFIDTNLVASGSAQKISQQSNVKGPLAIGALPNGTRSCTGMLDDIIIWPRSLKSKNVRDAYGPPGTIRVIAQGDLPPGMTGPYEGILDVNALTPKIGDSTIYACGTNGLFYKQVGNGPWNLLSPITPAGGSQAIEADLQTVSFYNAAVGALLDEDGRLYLTSNGAATWQEFFPDLSPLISDPHIWGLKYLSTSAIILVGSEGWLSGGRGFIATYNPSTGVVNHLENNACGEYRGVEVVGTGNSAKLFAIGTNGQIRQYLTSSTSGVDISPTYSFNSVQSAEFTSTGGYVVGILGTRDGRVLKYDEPSTSPWTITPIAGTLDWVIGVRTMGLSDLAVSTGTSGGTPTATIAQRNGSSSLQLNPAPFTQAAVVWNKGTLTYAIPAGGTLANHYGLPGVTIP
jgi:hypothetical protein